MNKLLYVLFLSTFLLDYLSFKLGLLSRYVTWFPELLSMLTALIVAARFMIIGGKNIPPKCVFFIVIFLLNIIIGIIINTVPPGPLIAGLRIYLKFIPFFFLPFVYHFSDQQINGQLKLLLLLFIIQAPIALYQRLVLSTGLLALTGDLVTGTLNSSGHLTAALTCAVAVLMSFYLAKRLSLTKFLILFSLLFIPMTINETKSTLILLPIALFLPIFLSSGDVKIKQLILVTIIGVLTGITFVFVYDYFMSPKWGYGILDFLTMEDRVKNYLSSDETRSQTDSGPVGKIDSYVYAFRWLSENALNLVFGLGIGNASESSIPALTGEYGQQLHVFGVKTTSLSLILWETGLLGALLYYVFYFMTFKDAKFLSLHGGLVGTLANGWSVVAVLMMLSIAYKNVIGENVLSYLFWYFSGYIISESYRYKRMNLKIY